MLPQKRGSPVFNEILEQPQVLQQTLAVLDHYRADLQAWLQAEQIGQVLFVGSGSSLNVGHIAARTMHGVRGINAWAWPSAEVLMYPLPPYDRRIKTLHVFISRSGETTEVLWAMHRLKQLDPRAISLTITCKPGNPLSGMGQKAIILDKAMDESPVSTKSFTSMLMAAQMLTAWLMPDERFLNELRRIPGVLNLDARKSEIQRLAGVTKPVTMMSSGHGIFYGVAAEAAVKFKQMANTQCDTAYTMELRHGLGSAVNPTTMQLFFISDTWKALEVEVVWDMAKLQGPRFSICEETDARLTTGSEQLFEMKSGLWEPARAIPCVAVAQLLAFYMGIAKGGVPDKPRQAPAPVKIASKLKTG